MSSRNSHFKFAMALVALIATCLSFQNIRAATLQSDPRNELETATASLQKGDLGRADAAARAVIAATQATASMKAVAFNILGIVNDQREKFLEAENYYRKAITLDPSLIAARNNLGNLYFKTRREREAIAQYQFVLRVDPRHTEANLNLGLIYQATGRAALALSHLERARARASGDARLMVTLAGIYFEANQKEKALSALDDLLKSSSDPRTHFTVGLMLARRGLYKEAADRFSFVVKQQPDSYEALYNYGLALEKLERTGEAERAFSAAADLKPDLPDMHYRLALLYSAAGDGKRAIEEFNHTIERDPQNVEANFLLGLELAKQGQMEAAAERYKRATELSPKTVAYWIKLAEASLKLYRYSHAEQAYRQALAIGDVQKGEFYYLVGYALRAQGKVPEAVEFFKKEIAIHPAHIESLTSLGFFEIELTQFADAEKHLNEALRLKPNHVTALYELGRLYLKQKRYAEAEKTLRHVIALKPDHTQVHYQMYLVYERTNRPAEAARMMEVFKKLEEEDKREREARERQQKP